MSNPTDPISVLCHVVVRLECISANGDESTGSGYIFRLLEDGDTYYPAIITNRHVVSGAVTGIFHLTLRTADDEPDIGNHEKIIVPNLQRLITEHPNTAIDLAAISLGEILTKGSKDPYRYYFRTLGLENFASDDLLDALSPMEPIVMLGYPNGIWDEKHNMPIIRRGSTATHAKLPLNGKPEFLIDAACFPGSSGSPVFLANIGAFSSGADIAFGSRIALLGTLYSGPLINSVGEVKKITPTDSRFISVNQSMMNLGFVISAKEILGLQEEIKKSRNSLASPPSSRSALCPCNSGRRYKHCCGSLAS